MWGSFLCNPILPSVTISRSHVSIQDWFIGYQVSDFDGQWKLDTWRFLSAEKAENRWGWQLQGSGERQLCEAVGGRLDIQRRANPGEEKGRFLSVFWSSKGGDLREVVGGNERGNQRFWTFLGCKFEKGGLDGGFLSSERVFFLGVRVLIHCQKERLKKVARGIPRQPSS